MANLKIKNAPLIPDDQLENSIKLPTGGKGNYAVSLGQIANYTKNSLSLAVQSSIDELRNTKADKANTYTKEEVDERISLGQGGVYGFKTYNDFLSASNTIPPNSIVTILEEGQYQGDNIWDGISLIPSPYDPVSVSKEYTDSKLVDKANVSDVYTKIEADSLLDDKLNVGDVYDNQEIDNLLLDKVDQAEFVNKTDSINEDVSYIYKHGAALPYDSSIEYAENSLAFKDGELQQLVDGAWLPFKKTVDASDVKDASGETQQQVNYNGGSKWHSRVGGYLENERVVLTNGDIVKSTIDGNTNDPNVDMTGWVKTNTASQIFDESGLSQQEINDGVESIADLIAIPNPKNGTRVFLKSYHAGAKRGGFRYFVYDENGRRDSHNGGTVIDPTIPIPSLATFNTYFTPRVTNDLGVWVQESSTSLILASEFGAIPADDMFWNCACVNAALRFAQRNSLVNIDGSTVKVEHGVYQTTNPIVNTSIFAGSRCPALIGGDNFLDVTFIKTTNNTVGSGYVGGDVDAVIYVSPTTANGNYVIGEHTSGFELMHSTALANTGYGYYARNSVIAYRGNILGRNNYHNIFQDDCWQTTYGEIWSVSGSYGITAKYATSCIGGPLYVDGAKLGGFDFTSLTYSDLVCACDHVGTGLNNGAVAYNFKDAKGVTGLFSTEFHKGTEFYFENSMGLTLAGRSFGTTAVETSATKVHLNTDTKNSVDFSGYDWSATTNGLSASEFLKYKFTNQIYYAYYSSLKFNACGVPEDNPVFMKNGLGIPHGKMQTQVSHSGFSHVDGVLTTTMYLQGAFSELCFIGGVSSIEFLTYYCIDSGKDFGVTFAGKASNPKRFLVGGISTDQNSPTVIGAYIAGDTQTSNTLEAYIDSNNWLRVRNGNSVNNGNYRIVMST